MTSTPKYVFTVMDEINLINYAIEQHEKREERRKMKEIRDTDFPSSKSEVNRESADRFIKYLGR